ncbi:Amino transferase, class V [Ehrlichia canis str. Jake]|uniref:Amino transferase, class V n=1 Tax=Ehrlichia canis (strain Jake) TaxID=269484 RepID=A0ACA6AVP6_EHRCJ|nr:Amino transferase, class V [Ehrlichia canis str. Jake]
MSLTLSVIGNKMGREGQIHINLPVFLDYQSTTKTDDRVLEAMIPYFQQFSNPHSRSHSFGWKAESAVELARERVASLINAEPKEVIFTSGATESNNLAVKGVANFYKNKGNHIITVRTEHKCVLDSCRHLETEGFNVTYLDVQKNGIINLDLLKSYITDKTILVSVMMVNNEIGVIQPVEEIGKICHEHGIFFHTDAAQAFGKIPIDVNKMNIDLLSISGHKIYGPMGIGALYIRKRQPRVRLTPLINGGGQERGMRSGTIPTPLAVGLGEAARIAQEVMEEENIRIKELRDILYNEIKKHLSYVVLNGDYEQRISGNLNLSFPYVEGESIIMAINNLAVSSGSACTSASLEPSYVLRALNIEKDLEHSSIRFGIGRFTTKEEILYAAELIVSSIKKLREMSPLWEMVQEGIDLNNIKWDTH